MIYKGRSEEPIPVVRKLSKESEMEDFNHSGRSMMREKEEGREEKVCERKETVVF